MGDGSEKRTEIRSNLIPPTRPTASLMLYQPPNSNSDHWNCDPVQLHACGGITPMEGPSLASMPTVRGIFAETVPNRPQTGVICASRRKAPTAKSADVIFASSG